MATGAPAFSGTTLAAIFAAILKEDPPPPSHLNPNLPAELERITNKALEKDRDVRYQVASEMRADLKRLKRNTGSPRSAASAVVAERGDVPAATKRRRWVKSVPATAAAAIIVAASLAYLLTRSLPPPRVLRIAQITDSGHVGAGCMWRGQMFQECFPNLATVMAHEFTFKGPPFHWSLSPVEKPTPSNSLPTYRGHGLRTSPQTDQGS